jgi:hypothetical protein
MRASCPLPESEEEMGWKGVCGIYLLSHPA